MRKLFLPLIAVALIAAMMYTPAWAQPSADAAPLPAGTASPRDWTKLAPDGSLLPEKIKGDSAVLIDAYTGKVLFEKDADEPRYPASTTKIMTCLLALESGKSLSETVTIGTLPAADFAADSDNIGLKKGEEISFEDLLGGMMVKSGNDAADAIAIHVAGSVEAFVEMMNQKAQELGMTGTHYTCTNGLTDDTEHKTTPSDMAKLAMAAVQLPEFVKLVSYPTYTIPPTNMTDKERTYASTNKLLGESTYGYVYATGIKTGYTSMAQNSLISSAEKDGMKLIAVDMHVDVRDNMWTDSVTMFEYGFNYYDTVNLKDLVESQTAQTEVKDAVDTDPGMGSLNLTIKPQGDKYITDLKDKIAALKSDPSQLRQELSFTKDTAPIASGETVGTATYYYDGNPELVCDLIATRDVEAKAPAPSAAGETAGTPAPGDPPATGKPVNQASGGGSVVTWLVVSVMLIALALLAIRIWNMRRRGRHSRKYSYRQGGNVRMRR